jgi:hypothetical protein
MDFAHAVAVHNHLRDGAPASVGHDPLRLRVRQKRHVAVLQRRPHASHVCIGLSVGKAREAVEPVAAHEASCLGVGLVQVDADWQVERPVPGLLEVVGELLRGSCDTAGFGNGPDRGGSVGSSPACPCTR